MKTDNNRKVLIIGLDGVTFRILQSLIENGVLSNISELVNNGVSGILKSVYPPISCVAWTSFLTGKNPGKHGIYSWSQRLDASYETKGINSSFIQEPTLYEIANIERKRAIIVNVPVTYPPKKINGAIVCGMLSPSVDDSFLYPPDLLKKILSKTGEYVIDINWIDYASRTPDEFLNNLHHCTKKRAEASFYLMDNIEWDVFITVFTETDRLQHLLWNIIDETHPRFDKKDHIKYQKMVWEYFRYIDEIIGEFRKRISNDTDVFIISDHGFGPVEKEFYINRWLVEEGLLVLQDENSPFLEHIKSFAKTLGINRKRIKAFFNKLSIDKSTTNSVLSTTQPVDWSRTKAYSIYAHGININLEGREPKGCIKSEEYDELRDDIIKRITTFKDPDNGNNIVQRVFKSEEIYHGSQAYQAPDLILSCGENRYTLKHGAFEEESIFKSPFWRNGTHRMDGIFIAHGKYIKKGETVKDAQLIDILPTVLYNMGLPLLNDFDGKILSSIFDEDFTKSNPPRYKKTNHVKSNGIIFNQDEEQRVEERLKGLGYV